MGQEGIEWRTRWVKAKSPPLRVGFDRRLMLELHGSKITSDGRFLPVRELEDALACNITNSMRTLALPEEVEHWPLTTIREKLA